MLTPRNPLGQTFQGYTLTVELATDPINSIYLGKRKPGGDSKESLIFTYMHAYVLKEPLEQKSFGEDAQQLQKLKHSHILPLVLYGLDEGIPYTASEFAAWRTLQTRIRRKGGQTFSLLESLRILTKIGQALYYAHQQGIVHGMLSDHTILFNNAGDVFLTGFSFPTLRRAKSTTTGQKEEEMPCLAPEQRDGQQLPESDQYALGCLAYMLFTGHWPLSLSVERGQPEKRLLISPNVYNPALPESLSQATLKALMLEPEERYGSVAEFVEALLAIQRVMEGETPPQQSSSLGIINSGLEHNPVQPMGAFPDYTRINSGLGTTLHGPLVMPTPLPDPITPVPSLLKLNDPGWTITRVSSAPPLPQKQGKSVTIRKQGRSVRARVLLIGSSCIILSLILASFLLFFTSNHYRQNSSAALASKTITRSGTTSNPPGTVATSGLTTVPAGLSTPSHTPSPASTAKSAGKPATPTSGKSATPIPSGNSATPTSSGTSITPTPTATSSQASVTYSFENGELDGWEPTGCTIGNSTAMAESGTHSLVVTSPNLGRLNPYIYLSGSNSIQPGQVVIAYVYVPDGTVKINSDVSLYDTNGIWYDSASYTLSQGVWNRLTYTVPSIHDSVINVGIDLFFASSGGKINPVYIDNISW